MLFLFGDATGPSDITLALSDNMGNLQDNLDSIGEPLTISAADDLDNLSDAESHALAINLIQNISDNLKNLLDAIVINKELLKSETDNLNNWNDIGSVNLLTPSKYLMESGSIYLLEDGASSYLIE